MREIKSGFIGAFGAAFLLFAVVGLASFFSMGAIQSSPANSASMLP